MRALIQRVRQAEVTIAGECSGRIGQGLLILLGVATEDDAAHASYLANKVRKLRIFSDDAGKMNRSLEDVQGAALVVSQFTLLANCQRGNRPSYSQAAAPEHANALYQAFMTQLREANIPVESGRFGADMQVSLCNDGPVTIWLDTAVLMKPAA